MLVFDIIYAMFQHLVVKFCSKFIITKVSIIPIVYYCWFWLQKILFQNCGYKLVKFRESRFKHTAILGTSSRVCQNNMFFLKNMFSVLLNFFMLYVLMKSEIFFSLTSILKSPRITIFSVLEFLGSLSFNFAFNFVQKHSNLLEYQF